MLSKTLRSFVILTCVVALPLMAKPQSHAYDYATRLAALLADTQGKATLSADAWKKVGNEGNALANKLYASTSGKNRTAAKEARTHVREMRAAAMKGDADGAKMHAGMALPYVYQIIEATAPKK